MVPRSHEKWNGDVWKSIVEIRTRMNIDTYVCFADEGIGLIIKRENRNRLNINISDFKRLKFSDYYKNFKIFMNVISHKDISKILNS